MTTQHSENPTLSWDNRSHIIIAGHTHYHAVNPDSCLPNAPLSLFQHCPAAAVELTTAAGIGAQTPTADTPAEEVIAAQATPRILRAALDAGDDTPDMVICGDAYDAIQHLTALEGLRTPQLVYIDPPYNTGTIFTDYSDGLDHHLWLGMMRTRLTALRDALAPSGSIWVHLDDSEMPYARVLLDEIFGRENFIAQIVVEINPKGRQLDRFFAACHDYLLVYAKDASRLTLEPGITGSVDPQDFPYEDSQGRYRLLPLRNTNKKFNPVTAHTMSYPLYANPDTGAVRISPFAGAEKIMPVFGDLQPAVWRWSAPTVAERPDELLARNVRGRKGTRLDIFQIDRMHPGRRKKLKTIWPASEVGSSDSAKLQLRKKFGDDIQFATPKPEPLLERIINAATEPGDYVWDVFAGSGTTGVVAHRLGRHFIMAESNPSTVTTHIRMRMDDAGATPIWLAVEPRY